MGGTRGERLRMRMRNVVVSSIAFIVLCLFWLTKLHGDPVVAVEFPRTKYIDKREPMLLDEVNLDTHFEMTLNDEICRYDIKCPNVIAIERIERGHITKPNGVVYDEAGDIHSYGYWWTKDQRVPTVPDVEPIYLDKAISFARIWEQHFQHAAMGGFIKARYFCNWITTEPNLSVVVMNDVQKNVLHFACPQIPLDAFVLFDRGEVIVQDLYIIHFAASISKPQSDVLSLAASPPNIIKLPVSDVIDTVFYMQRRASLGKRYVLNDREVVNALRDFAQERRLKFEIYDGRIDKLSRASHIIGPHGGAFGNIIYANSRTKVIEFISSKGMHKRPCYALLSGSLSLTYVFVEPKVFNFDFGGMVMDMSRLLHILRSM